MRVDFEFNSIHVRDRRYLQMDVDIVANTAANAEVAKAAADRAEEIAATINGITFSDPQGTGDIVISLVQ